MTMVEIRNDEQLIEPKQQWCLCPLNRDDMLGDILLPDQGEVKIGRAILGVNIFYYSVFSIILLFCYDVCEYIPIWCGK